MTTHENRFRRPLWPYGHTPLPVSPQALLQSLDALPEDIYVFGLVGLWTLVLNQDDGKRRIAFSRD